MEKKTVDMKKQKISGLIMVIVGFAMLLVNALSYIFRWDIRNPAFTVMGLVFVLIGMKMAHK